MPDLQLNPQTKGIISPGLPEGWLVEYHLRFPFDSPISNIIIQSQYHALKAVIFFSIKNESDLSESSNFVALWRVHWKKNKAP